MGPAETARRAAEALATRQDRAGALAIQRLDEAAAELAAVLAMLAPEGVRLGPADHERVRREVERAIQRADARFSADLQAAAAVEVDAALATVEAMPFDRATLAAAAQGVALRRPLEIGTAARAGVDLGLSALGLLMLRVGSYLSQRPTARQLADAMATGPASAVRSLAPRWRVTADNYVGTAANQALLAAASAAQVADPRVRMMKRDFEILDLKRNHPISRVLDGQTIPVAALFRAPVADVEMWARRLHKSSGGIFWREDRGSYVGLTLPAHFGERGVVVPWLPKWGTTQEIQS